MINGLNGGVKSGALVNGDLVPLWPGLEMTASGTITALEIVRWIGPIVVVTPAVLTVAPSATLSIW